MKKSSDEGKKKPTQESVGEEYASSLADLTVNSKPLINMLTILAEENILHAPEIVKSVEKHLAKVGSEIKLPVLYLVDSIIKNVGGAYKQLFTQCIVNMFCAVFEKVDERVRAQMYKLRQTWNEVFSGVKLYTLDVRVNCIDPAWPITATPPKTNSIHVNPNFLKKTDEDPAVINANAVALVAKAQDTEDMRTQIITKQRELLQLEQRKLELQLEATKKKIEEQKMQLKQPVPPVSTVLVESHASSAPNTASAFRPSDNSKIRQPPLQPTPPSVATLKTLQNGPRIAPVSSGLININTARKSRDPRLARQFHDTTTESMSNVITTSNLQHPNYLSEDIKNIQPNVNCVFDNSVKILNKTKPKPITINLECANNNSSNNMKSVNKFNVQKSTSRKDPRLINKVTNPSLEKSKSLSLKNSAQTKSKTPISRKSSDKSNSSTSKGSSSSADKTSPKSQKSNRDKSGSTETTEPIIASPSKHKDSPRKSSNSSSSLSSNSLKSSSVRSRSNKSSTKHADAVMRHVKSESKQIRKSKDSNKVRTNVRRNRTDSTSADVPGCSKDIDLRLLAPPEKQLRIQEPFETTQPLEPLDKKLIENSAMDIDLRSLAPPHSPGSLSKKRSSSEKLEQQTLKKKKTEMFDVLFGNEDVDLRKLPSDTKLSISEQHRVYTPPPPIISTNFLERLPEEQIISSSNDSVVQLTSEETDLPINIDVNTTGGWAKVKETVTVTTSPAKCISPSTLKLSPSSLDAVRAKLAEATKTKDRLGRPLLYNKLPDDPTERRRTISVSSINKDVDLRPRSIDSIFDSQDGMETKIKIIMLQAQEQLKAGSINFAQYNVLVKQIFQINETKKLYEAKRRESLEPNKTGEDKNIDNEISASDLTPISDDELLVEGDALNKQSPSSVKETSMSFEENLQEPNSSPLVSIENESSEMEVESSDNKPVDESEQSQSVNLLPPISVAKTDEKPIKERQVKNSNMRHSNTSSHEIMTGPRQHNEPRHRMPLPQWNGVPPWQQQQQQQQQQHWDHRHNWNRGPVPPHVRHMYPPQWRHPPHFINHDVDPRFRKFDNRPHNGRFHGPPGYNRQMKSPPPLGSKDMRGGQVDIRNMPRTDGYGGSPSPPIVDNMGNNNVFNKEAVKHIPGRMIQPAGRNSPETFARQSPGPINTGGLEVLSSVMPSSMAPASSYSGYQVETPITRPPLGYLDLSGTLPTNPLIQSIPPPTTTVPPPGGTLPTNIDVNELFEKLVATGIVPGIGGRLTTTPPPQQSSKPKLDEIKPATFTDLESLKIQNPSMLEVFYNGMQCSSCGARFPPEQTMKYSQHLDWHFRQNRRDRDSARKAHSRKWHYDVSDWIQYEEIEDLEEREKNWFENQQAQVNEGTKEENKTEEIPTVAAGSLEADARCDVCQEKFDEFYNEDKEEWQLKMAIRVDNVTYHPLCYEDFRKSLTYESEGEPDSKKTDLPVDIQKLFENIEKKGRKSEDPDDSSDEDIFGGSLKNIVLTEATNNESLKPERTESPDTTESIPNTNTNEPAVDTLEEKMEVDTENEPSVDKKEDDDVTIQEPIIETVNLKDEDDDDEDNQFEDIGTLVKIKQEPLDDYEGDLNDSFIPEVTTRAPDTTHASLISSIDGNIELQPAEQILTTYNKIKINISTNSLGTQKEKLCDDPSKPPTYNVKESLRGVEFQTLEPVKKGTELSGLCSIM